MPISVEKLIKRLLKTHIAKCPCVECSEIRRLIGEIEKIYGETITKKENG